MLPLTTTFQVPTHIAAGLANGSLIRNGGVIQDASGQIVMWLKEVAMSGGMPGGIPVVDPVTGVLNLAMEGVNAGISIRGFAGVTQQLNQLQGAIAIATGASVLTLGISAMGFAMLAKRLKELEQRLEHIQRDLEKVNRKLDLSFYVNFRAALDLATNAFTMSQGDNRRSSALNAINRFLEAEHVYAELADQEIEHQTAAAGEYLTTLALSYVAEARCYLELGEFETATRRLQEGRSLLRQKFERYVEVLLTSCPAMYLDPCLQGQIDLARLTRVYQWENPEYTESAVFEKLRQELTVHTREVKLGNWVKNLPVALTQLPSDSANSSKKVRKKKPTELIQDLPMAMERIEAVIETSQRFTGYVLETQLLSKLEMSFSDWLKLMPEGETQQGANLVFVCPDQPLEIAVS